MDVRGDTGIVKEAYDFTDKADVINEVAFFEAADYYGLHPN